MSKKQDWEELQQVVKELQRAVTTLLIQTREERTREALGIIRDSMVAVALRLARLSP